MKCEVCENPPEATHVRVIGTTIVPLKAQYVCETCITDITDPTDIIWFFRSIREDIELEIRNNILVKKI